MQSVFDLTIDKYIQLKGRDGYDKLYSKISRSDALTEICGLSVRRGLPPTAGDFIYKATMMPSIYLTFDNAKSTMAALIMLQIWDKRVNSVYRLCSDAVVNRMAKEIISSCVSLY